MVAETAEPHGIPIMIVREPSRKSSNKYYRRNPAVLRNGRSEPRGEMELSGLVTFD
jgi:hypothetical protein